MTDEDRALLKAMLGELKGLREDMAATREVAEWFRDRIVRMEQAQANLSRLPFRDPF